MATTFATTDPKPSLPQELVSIFDSLPVMPKTGFKTSEFAMYMVKGLGIIIISLFSFLYPNAGQTDWYAVAGIAVLFLFAVLYGMQRYVLKQSNIKLLADAVAAYKTVQVEIAKSSKFQLPVIPDGVVTGIVEVSGPDQQTLGGAALGSGPQVPTSVSQSPTPVTSPTTGA